MTPRYCSFFSIYPQGGADKCFESEFSGTDVLVIQGDTHNDTIKHSLL